MFYAPWWIINALSTIVSISFSLEIFANYDTIVTFKYFKKNRLLSGFRERMLISNIVILQMYKVYVFSIINVMHFMMYFAYCNNLIIKLVTVCSVVKLI